MPFFFFIVYSKSLIFPIQQGKELYDSRKQTIERSFADSKNNHGYRYAMYRGLEKNQNYTWLICAAQNMKTIALRKHRKAPKSPKGEPNSSKYDKFICIFINFTYFIKNDKTC